VCHEEIFDTGLIVLQRRLEVLHRGADHPCGSVSRPVRMESRMVWAKVGRLKLSGETALFAQLSGPSRRTVAAPWCARMVRGEEGDRRVQSVFTVEVRGALKRLCLCETLFTRHSRPELTHGNATKLNELDGTFTFGSTLGKNILNFSKTTKERCGAQAITTTPQSEL
jgi:hypothetical protein